MDTTLSAPIGQLLDGRYLVESQLARGGMATVYRGRDVRLDRIVALKIAHPEFARDPEFTGRFISEARAVARLSSPNVVAVFDQGSTGDIKYIAMEYVPGPTLRELLTARGKLSPREALDIIEGVLTGLAAAHNAGIIHRDVKPENVLLGSGSTIKVADFGLARAAAAMRNTKSGLLIGTAAYLAPEQVAANTSDQRTDVYAAGVLLFEMLTGAQPHTGDTPLAVAYKHVNAVVPAPSSLVPELPAALDALVALGTSRDPELRPPDAGQYLDAIAQVRRGLPLPLVRRGAHAAPPSPAGGSDFRDQHARNGGTFSLASTGRLGASGGHAETASLAGSPQHAQAPGLAGANQTMIVPADREPDYPSPARRYSAGRGTRGYSEPFLQRWLFSRRILAVLAVIVVATATWWLVSGRYFSVPKATGMPVAAARAELTSAGLVVEIGKAKYSDTVAKGEVIATYPGAGQSVTRGSQITIIPSLGPVMVTMPNVTGQTVSVAEQTLRAAGLKVGKPVYQASSIQPGIVISTNPVAYSQWAKDKPIQLVVSAGPPLPNFVGQLLTAAQQQAQQGGYAIDAVTVASSSQPAGIVLSQSPQPGTPIAPGEVVVLQVSPGPAMVTVPNVIGMTEHEAVKALEEAGFVPQIQGGTFGGRTVTDYSPQGQQPQGSTILVIIGLGL